MCKYIDAWPQTHGPKELETLCRTMNPADSNARSLNKGFLVHKDAEERILTKGNTFRTVLNPSIYKS